MDEFVPLITYAALIPNPSYEFEPCILRVSVADILNPEYEVLFAGDIYAGEFGT